MTTDAGMVIIGAGECGARAAFALRDKGYAGPVHLIDAERHLPYERPHLSKTVLASDSADARFVTSQDQLLSAQIVHHRATTATAIDREGKTVELCNQTSLSYDKLLLATGARPRKLMQDGVDIPGIHYLRSMDDCIALRGQVGPGTRLVLLGAGFLGLEIAATASLRGASVIVVEPQARILTRGVPEPIARVIADRHLRQGVEIVCNARIARIDSANGRATIHLEDGAHIVGDVLVASVGALPNVELAIAAGLSADNGILVDEYLVTQDKDIFAAGDCCAFPLASQDGKIVRLESWRNALDQSAVAAANMIGEPTPYTAVPWFWSDHYELTLQVAGLADPDLAIVRRDLGSDAFLLFHLDSAGRLMAASGIGAGSTVARDIRLAEKLIARRAHPDPTALARPDATLKAMLS